MFILLQENIATPLESSSGDCETVHFTTISWDIPGLHLAPHREPLTLREAALSPWT